MSQVVYEIDISDSPEEKPKKKRVGSRPDQGPESDPGVAVSSSIVLTGLGQYYNGQSKLGFLFFLIMVCLYVFSGVLFMNWPAIDAAIATSALTHSQFALICASVLALGALIWNVGIIQAYVKALGFRRGPYKGTPSRVLPALASLLIPGWGQFLNGQAKKGALALALTTLTVLGAVTAALIFLLWDNFQNPADRLLLEKVMVISLSPLMFVPFFWAFCFYDALVVGLDEDKKEPLWTRLKYAKARLQMKGFKKGVVFPALITLGLSAGLVLVGAVGYYFVEKSFYLRTMESAKTALEKKNMVILPELISRGQALIAPAQEDTSLPREPPLE